MNKKIKKDSVLSVLKKGFFVFTATPKPARLEKFGRQGPDGKFHPFHLYSIERKRELDLYKRYATDPDFNITIAQVLVASTEDLLI